MPTSATTTYTQSGVDPLYNAEDAMESIVDVQIKPSSTLAAGTVVGEITASPGVYAAYASGNMDGTEVARGILRYAAVTDSGGNIVADEWGGLASVTPMYGQGTFATQDLTGLDSGAIEDLGGHLVEGDTSTGIFSF